jgi:hypothetical protein
MARCQLVHDIRQCPVQVGSPQTQVQRDQVHRVISHLQNQIKMYRKHPSHFDHPNNQKRVAHNSPKRDILMHSADTQHKPNNNHHNNSSNNKDKSPSSTHFVFSDEQIKMSSSSMTSSLPSASTAQQDAVKQDGFSANSLTIVTNTTTSESVGNAAVENLSPSSTNVRFQSITINTNTLNVLPGPSLALVDKKNNDEDPNKKCDEEVVARGAESTEATKHVSTESDPQPPANKSGSGISWKGSLKSLRRPFGNSNGSTSPTSQANGASKASSLTAVAVNDPPTSNGKNSPKNSTKGKSSATKSQFASI